MKESAATKFKSFQIPVDWMLETGITSQVSNIIIIYLEIYINFTNINYIEIYISDPSSVFLARLKYWFLLMIWLIIDYVVILVKL